MSQQLGPLQRKWVMTLRKHPERQIKGRLGKKENGTYKYCCLGQGGLIAGICKFKGDVFFEIKSENNATLHYYSNKLGLFNKYGNINYPTKYGRMSFEPIELTSFNDSPTNEWGGWTDLSFMMEACPELFFSREV